MFNKQVLGKVAVVLTVVLSLLWAVGGEYIGYFIEDFQLSRQMASDPRYQIVQEVEEGCFNGICRGLYVVDIEIAEESDGGTAAVIYLMFDKREIMVLDEREYDEKLDKRPITIFIQEANVGAIRIMDRIGGYDWIGVAYVYPYPVMTFSGYQWQSDVLFLIYGPVESMRLWADDGATEEMLQSYLYTQKLQYYGLSMQEAPKQHNNVLPRLHRDGTPVWELSWEFDQAERAAEESE